MKKLFILILAFLSGSCGLNDSDSSKIIDGGMITAAYNVGAVESFASSFSPGLRLMLLKSDDVTPDGYSEKWNFEYSSGGLAVSYHFHTSDNGIGFDSTSTFGRIGIEFISHRWCNSDAALKIAGMNGGREFMQKNPGSTIKAVLSEPLVPNSSTYWYITYISKSRSDLKLSLTIDANTSRVRKEKSD